ncbi:MAG: hypothetical protein F6J87_12355 [Spirulina sp. SIO3F2]|nr:hypothetical protein [Spirulina sp. SIO3F2]
MASNDFFLEPDEAKTLGDIDYMRESNTVKHTFPGNKNNGGSFAIVKEVNSTEERTMSGPAAAASSSPSSASSTSTNQPTFTPRRSSNTDTGMDMFRKMAKGMKR